MLRRRFTDSRWLAFFSTFVSIVVIDQATKVLAEIMDWSHLNRGISFGLGSAYPFWVVVFMVSVLFMLSWAMFHFHFQDYPIASGLFLGGGLSNLLDRIWAGGVRDWLLVPGTTLHNNMADWAIFSAIIVMVADGVKRLYVHPAPTEE